MDHYVVCIYEYQKKMFISKTYICIIFALFQYIWVQILNARQNYLLLYSA